jgi:hypothetical protein
MDDGSGGGGMKGGGPVSQSNSIIKQIKWTKIIYLKPNQRISLSIKSNVNCNKKITNNIQPQVIWKCFKYQA